MKIEKVKTLVANLHDKTEHVIHIRSLEQDDTAEDQEWCTKKRYMTPAKQIEEKSASIIKLTGLKDSGLTTKEILAE